MRIKKVLIFSLLLLTAVLLVGCKKKKGDAVISGETETVIRVGSTFDPMAGIRANDTAKGDVTSKITVEGTVNVEKEGTYALTYKVKASNGKEATLERTVEVKAIKVNGMTDRKVALGSYGFNVESGVTVDDPMLGTLRASTEAHQQYFTIDGEVNTEVIGVYQISYTIKIDNYEQTFIRNISVVNEAIINVPDLEEQLEIGGAFNPMLGVTASRPIEVPVIDPDTGEETDELRVSTQDVKDFVHITGSVDVDTAGTYTLTYRITDPDDLAGIEFLKDTNGEVIEVVKTVTVYILVEIRGISPAIVTEGGEFDPMAGVTGYDSLDGIITNKIQVVGNVNLDRIGNYTLTYILEGSQGVTDMKTRNVTVQAPVEGLQEIVIMAGDVKEVDPFHPEYSGVRQEERQAAQEAAEEKHNVKVIYKLYPDNAAWGQDRINALIQAGVAGEPLADIFYHVTTDWLVQLADGGAIAPVTNYVGEGKPGEVINQKIIDAGFYGGNHYGFSTGALTLDSGLYFNVNLLKELGIPNPAQLYLDGEWNWSGFKNWVEAAQLVLNAKGADEGDDYFTLGGAISYFGENLIPLNGGKYLDMQAGEVKFADEKGLQTFDFIKEVYDLGVWEKNRGYDAGSAEWQAGKVLMHPGSLWFVKAANRWGNLQFELGFVPYPKADDYDGEYASPIYGSSIFYLSSGHTADKNELAFNVWIDLQLWEGEFSPEQAFRNGLDDKFEDELYIDVYMTVYDTAYVEFVNSIGVPAYGSNSLKLAINGGIPDGSYATKIAEIAPTYDYYLKQYVQGKK